MPDNRFVDLLLKYKRVVALASGVVMVLISFLVADLPLARIFFEKAHRTYEMDRRYGSVEILDEKIKQQRNLRDEVIEIVSHLRSKEITKNRLAPIIELFDRSARDSKASLVSVSSSSQIEEEKHTKIPFEIELRGEYHQIAQFVNKVENSTYPLKVEQLEISTRDYVSYDLNARLKIALYFVRE